MLPNSETSYQYKTVVLIGGELHNIQVVIEKDEKEFEAVVPNPSAWETRLYKQTSANPYEFLLEE